MSIEPILEKDLLSIRYDAKVVAPKAMLKVVREQGIDGKIKK